MSRRLFHAGRMKGRPMCPIDGSYHFGPFTLRPDIREWLQRGFAECESDHDVPEQYDCARCGTTTSLRPRQARQVAA